MKPMTTRERYQRMYDHREADRVPIWDHPWDSTRERWRREGMPADVDWFDYFDTDRVVHIHVDNSPQFESGIVEQTDRYKVVKTNFGATLRRWKHAGGTPEFLDFTVVDPDSWRKAKKRIQPTHDRINWDRLKTEYKTWKEKGAWIRAHLWFGFDITHAWMVGTERLLCAMAEEPEWCMDMFSHLLEIDLELFDVIWNAGYRFDAISWPDDMGYKNNQFFSMKMYREILKPYHKRAIEWAHAKGIKTHLHSCGDVRPFVDDLIEIGLDGLNPLEVKAGVDPIAMKKKYGDKLLLDGGINIVLWDKPEEIAAEIERVVPTMKENGGYVFSSDHSIPDSVSLKEFKRIVELAKKHGSYA